MADSLTVKYVVTHHQPSHNLSLLLDSLSKKDFLSMTVPYVLPALLADPNPKESVTALVNARLFDGTCAPVKDGATVLIRPYETKPELVELLGELSFSTYREFGFNKILLVEGPTEIKTVQQFLRKYQKDHEILLLSLGGSSLINASREHELREMHRVSPNVCALIDSERDSAGAFAGERVYALENGARRVIRRRVDLVDPGLAGRLVDHEEVREGAANINT